MAGDHEIEREIRSQIKAMAADDREAVTVRLVRERVEQKLDLDSGFLKAGPWKDRSKDIIQRAFDELESEDEARPSPSANNIAPKHKAKPAASPVTASPERAKKRKSPGREDQKAKRQKTAAPTKSPGPSKDEDEAEMLLDSELSDVIDEPAPAKRRKAKSDEAPKGRSKGGKKAPPPELTPQQAEIKTLQSQLAKCGIRRLWGKDLKKFDTDKQKISHLKGMLREVGMDGRFSEEKARKIKDEREFKADLAEIKEGNEKWGKEDDGDDEVEAEAKAGSEGGGERPKRRLARGLAQLQVFEDDEESE